MPIIDVRDSFDGGSGDLAGRVPDLIGRSDQPWAYISGQVVNESGAGYVERPSSPAGTGIYVVGGPRSPNYRVIADTQALTGVVSVGVIARALDANNYYLLSRSRGNAAGSWGLQRVASSGSATLAGAGGLPAGDFASVLELRVEGSRITALMDGAQVAQVTDAVLAAAGRGGLSLFTDASFPGTARVFGFDVVDLTNPVRMAG